MCVCVCVCVCVCNASVAQHCACTHVYMLIMSVGRINGSRVLGSCLSVCISVALQWLCVVVLLQGERFLCERCYQVTTQSLAAAAAQSTSAAVTTPKQETSKYGASLL